jgi:hypothetical protein
LYWALSVPWRVRLFVANQRRVFGPFFRNCREQGRDVLCMPQDFPRLVRAPLYLLAAPGPVPEAAVRASGLDLEQLLAQRLLRPLAAPGWYALTTLHFAGSAHAGGLRRLFLRAWNPVVKVLNTWNWRRTTRGEESQP